MNLSADPIRTIDLHAKNRYQAKTALDAALKNAGSAYRIRAIHGYHGGTAIRDLIMEEYASHPKVIRLVKISEGVTDLVLREFNA